MPLWTWTGLKAGKAATRWPQSGPDGQEGVLGMPRLDIAACRSGCDLCVESCPTQAIHQVDGEPVIDYGRCIVCQRCVEECPEGAMQSSYDWAFGVRQRGDLIWSAALESAEAADLRKRIAASQRRSLHIRHVDAGSCNACESEISALDNPFYNLHRLGIFFTPSPRFADLLMVTGPVTAPMHDVLLATWKPCPNHVVSWLPAPVPSQARPWMRVMPVDPDWKAFSRWTSGCRAVHPIRQHSFMPCCFW